MISRGLVSNEGPILWGISDNEMTIAEISETLLLNGPLIRGEIPGEERAMRPVWPLGVLTNSGNAVGHKIDMTESKIRWTFKEGIGFNFWVFNMDDAALSAGSQEVGFLGTAFGVWVD